MLVLINNTGLRKFESSGVYWDLTQIYLFLTFRKVNIHRVCILINYLFKFD